MKTSLLLEPLECRELLTQYTLTDLGLGTQAGGINQSGMAIGYDDYLAIDRHAAFFDDRSHMLGSDHHGLATAINNDGWATGWKQFTEGGPNHVFLAQVGNPIDQDLTPECFICRASGINQANQVVGYSIIAGVNHAFLWDGQAVDLGIGVATGINSQGWIVGQSELGATVWIDGKASVLGPGAAGAINDAGQIVGGSAGRAILWQDGVAIDLGLGAAHALNNHGQVVGEYGDYRSPFAFLWESGQMKKLNPLVQDLQGLTLKSATGINDAGQIVGWATTPTGASHAFRLDPVGSAPWWLGWAFRAASGTRLDLQ